MMVQDIVDGAGSLGFDSRDGQIEHSATTVATFLQSCVTQALIRGDGPHHSSLTSV